MNVEGLFFYLFSAIMIGSAFMVISSRNPVHSVLFLILAFFNAAGLFLLLGAEFLAMLLLIVYVGAVAVLFLFVVMMLDVDFTEMKQGVLKYLPLAATIGVIVLFELILVDSVWTIAPSSIASVTTPAPPGMTNTMALGRVLYTQYVYLFLAAGFILLTAMIGAIVLTLQHKVGVKRQDVSAQNARTPAEAVEIRKVPSRQGV
ncbi:NADH-quinone oxidoreductase subunit J [Methylocapsa palsarum]|uniref:NADH-quinone oxidoreductase subunit J n=1 Tax=Methylocapsa palsarum TaxID=1612308 RepID=A0A1I3X2F9_9HYPH|nr:NADH-quinone oxidoreductase subunit J [Methylocapsa palsarum]SFK13948.1 NADH-quinone oxidoreductase subunit J [Methylocapsa palsarum]